MSSPQPWLDSLSDDWPSSPATPTTPLPSRSVASPISRRSSLYNSPSRIPVPARRSVEPPPTDSPKKRVPRPCHFVKKEPPKKVQRNPVKPRTPKTPVKCDHAHGAEKAKRQTPASKQSPKPKPSPKPKTTPKPSPSPNPAVARNQQTNMNTRSPLRSVSNASGQTNQNESSTVQIKPKRSVRKDSTPEWRRRLVHGEIPGEQRDLFAPIGLENVFKPPSPGSETAQQEAIPVLKRTDPLWAVPDKDAEQTHDRRASQPATMESNDLSDEPGNSGKEQELNVDEEGGENPPELIGGTLEIPRDERKTSRQKSESHGYTSHNDTQLRSASGLEDLRNEGITPIYITLNSASRPGSRASDSALLQPQTESQEALLQEDSLLDVTSNSLPRDLSMGTIDFERRRPLANFRRGQYLSDGSFQRHQLSHSPLLSQRLSPSVLTNSRIRSSPPLYAGSQHTGNSSAFPRPSSSHTKVSASGSPEPKSASLQPSGSQQPSESPLKLFGNHDTFTNNRLLRRMSQFEGSLSDEDEPVSPSEKVRRKGESRGLLSVRYGPGGSHSMRRNERTQSRDTTSPKMNQFGDGELDDYDFSDTSPYEPKLLNYDIEKPYSHFPSRRRSSLSRRSRWHSPSQDYVLDSRTPDPSLSRKRRSRVRQSVLGGAMGNQSPITEEDQDCHDGKRMPNSPAKISNPKRRRTLPLPESPDQDQPDNGDVSSQFDGEISLLERNLMHHGFSDENTPFSRSQPIRRTRAPTPNQTMTSAGNSRSLGRKRSSPDSNEDVDARSSRQGVDVPKVKVTGANDEIRKGSITTQDFINEATKIMDQIRANGNTAGRLPSVEEFDMESGNDIESDEESTQEGFSRPPSREGVRMRKDEVPREPNPQLLNHLMKFQEDDHMELAENAFVTSLHLDRKSNQGHIHDAQDEDPQLCEPTGERLERRFSVPDGDQGSMNSMNSHASARLSTILSIPTRSSQNSQAKGVLPPDLISHLIPEQVNGLTYDRYRHQWVKGPVEEPADKPQAESSEEDPFGDIPDLSVDELKEMMTVESLRSPMEEENSNPRNRFNGANSTTDGKASGGKPESRPQTREAEQSVNGSTLQSKLTRFTSSVPNTGGTRATSWSADEFDVKERSQDIEHEIQLHEGRFSQPPSHGNGPTQQPRVVTISFSSPVVSHVAYGEDRSPLKPRSQPNFHRESLRHRALSLSGIAERDDEISDGQSLVKRCNSGQLEATNNENSMVHLPDVGQGTSYAFEMSALSDFTVNQVDHPHHPEVSYVDRRTDPTSLRQVHGRFALATEDLVKHITDAEPHELYWEDLRRLILRDKGLNGLYKLRDFCPRLEDLDVSDNDIQHLGGVPFTLRTLKIQRNLLSSQTAWTHLVNLQYLDISGNELENLHGFNELIHLRELKANNNNIRNIDGILDLNGLLSLKLSNNSLSEVYLEGSELTRLKHLDLSCNRLRSVTGLDFLPSLSTLNLASNEISEIDVTVPLYSLHSLKLSSNSFSTLDIGMFPSLALLYLDQNFLSGVYGLERCHRLEVLSVREQTPQGNEGAASYLDLDLGLVRDIRKVFVSSNRLSPRVLSPSVPLLGLQLLDIAACSVQRLPADFVVNFPNLKVLNLNFDSLTGIEELVGMKCLSRLTAVGNRITRMRRLCQVLSRMGKETKKDYCSLREVDLRGNPITVGFYPPPITGSGRNVEEKKIKARAAEDRPRGKRAGVDFPTVMADLGRNTDDMNHMEHPAAWGNDDDDDELSPERDVEVNDPYTVPPADAQADKKYLSHLDDPTKLRRSILELMLFVGSGGSIKSLDGLELHPDCLEQEGSDMNRAWAKLEELGVLKRRGQIMD